VHESEFLIDQAQFSKLPLVGLGDKTLKCDSTDLVGIFEMSFEPASGVEAAKLPSFAAQNEICFGILVAGVRSPLQLIILGA